MLDPKQEYRLSHNWSLHLRTVGSPGWRCKDVPEATLFPRRTWLVGDLQRLAKDHVSANPDCVVTIEDGPTEEFCELHIYEPGSSKPYGAI